jgi:hypothetical protein
MIGVVVVVVVIIIILLLLLLKELFQPPTPRYSGGSSRGTTTTGARDDGGSGSPGGGSGSDGGGSDGGGGGNGGGGGPLNAGDVITFCNGEWIVLDIQGDKAFILRKKLITFGEWMEYTGEYLNDMTSSASLIMQKRPREMGHQDWDSDNREYAWERSAIRTFLNGDFYNSFCDDCRPLIIETEVVTYDNPWYGTPGGGNTNDMIFLLSLEEVIQYFGDSGGLSAGSAHLQPFDNHYSVTRETDSCRYKEYGENIFGDAGYFLYDYYWQPTLGNSLNPLCHISDEYDSDRSTASTTYDSNNGLGSWWLRSPGKNQGCLDSTGDYIFTNWEFNNYAAYVNVNGAINVCGKPHAQGERVGMRPAMWIHIDGVSVDGGGTNPGGGTDPGGGETDPGSDGADPGGGGTNPGDGTTEPPATTPGGG